MTVQRIGSTQTDFAPSVYVQNGYRNREEYLNSLREEYGAEAVEIATSALPASEDFDGLVTTLEDGDWEI